ncbi:MAG: 3'-5' exonuclease [Methylovirgula sp.]|uniref:3'-5' exonuclease n=1 Tax=Methylovirgula sp. TaxID=1978224 RepID=UPI0030765B9D
MDVVFQKVWVIDVEGNGATPPDIVEMAMIEVNDLRLTNRQRHWLIRPQTPILPAATRIHGITNKQVADAPGIDDISEEIVTWTDGAAIVGHNVRVELDVIGRQVPDWKPAAAIDTLKLARTLKPGLESYSLEKLGAALGYTEEAARLSERKHHSAIYDATLTSLIYIDLISSLPEDRRHATLMAANLLDNRQGTLL